MTLPRTGNMLAGSLDPLRHALQDRYVLGDELGRGAMSVVFRARDLRHARDVAVKVLPADVSSAIGAGRFLREIGIAARLQHPHILPLLDSGDVGGLLYYVMPAVDGGSLRSRIIAERQLPIREAIRIAREVGSALACAHEHDVVHRDIKPENILLSSGAAMVADFGIARALVPAAGDEVRTEGLIIGTPGYMSPEQAVGDQLDGRSDIFSLGCVLYEMLAGERPFTGPTPQAITARIIHAPMPPLALVRGTIPAELEQIVERALAKHAADRFQTADELVRALEAVRVDTPVRGIEPVRTSRRTNSLIAGGVALLAVAAALSTSETVRNLLPGQLPPAADTTRLVVFPLEQEGSSGARTIHDHLLHTALSGWHGISVAEHYQVADVIRRRGPLRSSDDADAAARELGAGRYIRGTIVPVGDSIDAMASLFDIGSEQPLERATARVPSDPIAAATGFARLARELLLRGGDADLVGDEQAGRRSLPALQAFGRAQRALDEWDLATADSAFQAAVAFDPTDARSNLWLAQVRSWREQPAQTWAIVAERAVTGAASLTERERTLAQALVFLSGGKFERACAEYEALRQRNDRDFAAWFGLGECRRRDRLVVPAPSSPSGWRYRSSYRRAMEAYSTAFKLLPSVHHGFERGAFERLQVLLLVSTSLTPGIGVVGRDTSTFFSRPAWIGDTLALIPYPWEVIAVGGPDAIPPGFEEALDRQRAQFRQIADGWSAAFPQSSGAKEAVAIALELHKDRAAIDTIRLARRLAPDSARATRLAATEALLLLKFGAPDGVENLTMARALADSLLRGVSDSPAEPDLLYALAALVGRCDLAQRLARQTVTTPSYRIRQSLLSDAGALLARISLECPDEPAAPTPSDLATRIAQEYRGAPPSDRHRVQQLLLLRPALLASTLDSALLDQLAVSGTHSLLQAAGALVRHDSAGVRSALGAFETASYAGSFPVGPDFAHPGARLWLAIGDTTAAIRLLDRTLKGVTSYDPPTFPKDGAIVGSFIRAMILRAQLAAATNDRSSSTRWGNAARILWPDARSNARLERTRPNPLDDR